MGTYKQKACRIAFYDRSRIERELERMAAQGWVIDRPGGFFWRYRAAEPEKVHVAVVYVADASEFNAHPTASQELLQDLCAQDGWTLEASWGQMQIYYNRREDPAPIETDPVTQVETVRRAMRSNGIGSWLGSILMGLMVAGNVLWSLHLSPVKTLAAPYQFWMFLDGLLLLFIGGAELVSSRLWYRRALRAAEEEGRYLEASHNRITLWLDVLAIGILVGLLLSFSNRLLWAALSMAPVVLGILLARKLLYVFRKGGFSKRVTMVLYLGTAGLLAVAALAGVTAISLRFHLMDESRPVTTVERYGQDWDVYDDDLPLELEDLMEVGDLEFSREKRGSASFLVSNYRYMQWPLPEGERLDLRYEVTEVKWTSLYDYCLTSILDKRQDVIRDGQLLMEDHYEEADPAPWQADRVYQAVWEDGPVPDYVLCYGNRIVEIRLDQPPTADQRNTITEKLSA